MEETKNKGKSAMKVAISILLVTWILLLLVLAAICILRVQGYNSFAEWQNRKEVQEVLKQGIVNPSPTGVAAVTNTPTPTFIPTVSPTPTTTPTPVLPEVYTMKFSGNETVDAKLRLQAEKIFEVLYTKKDCTCKHVQPFTFIHFI